MMATLRQTVHTWYSLSCGCVQRELRNARGNTTDCLRCGFRVFVIETHYDKPESD